MVVSGQEHVTVFVVDDDVPITNFYHHHLDDRYDAKKAYSAEKMIEKLDSTVDVVFLDRLMPGLSGDELLDKIRENGYDCQVIMVTAVNPGDEILDMQFDDYLNKPVDRDDLIDAVEHQITVMEYDEIFQELSRTCAKISVLRESGTEDDLNDNNNTYKELIDEYERLKRKKSHLLHHLDYFSLDL